RCAVRKSARSSWPGSSSTVRLHRSMTRRSSRRALRTISRKQGAISGAPPVMSSSPICGLRARTSSTRAAVGSLIPSVRLGPASTWQWWHAWLQRLPTLTCRVVIDVRRSGPTPCARRVTPKSTGEQLMRARRGRPRPPAARRVSGGGRVEDADLEDLATGIARHVLDHGEGRIVRPDAAIPPLSRLSTALLLGPLLRHQSPLCGYLG